MPEENFEQQARKLTGHFSMEPQPAVWQRVKAAIAPPERRRRALLWWWLLPLCITGGIAAWLFSNKTTSSEATKILLINKEKKTNNSASPLEKRIIKKDDKTALQKEQKEERISLQNDSSGLGNKIDVERKIKAISARKDNKGQPPFTGELSDSKRDTKTTGGELSTMRKEGSNDVIVLSSASANALHNNKNSKDDSLVSSQNDDKKIIDTTVAGAITANVSADSALHNKATASVVKNKKKAIKKSFSIGVLAEVGTASLGSPLSGSKEKRNPTFLSATPGSLFNLTSGTVTRYKITNGVHLSLGLSVQKKLSKAVTLTGQVAYRYQQFGVSQTVFRDTSTGASNGNSFPGQSRGVYYDANAVQCLHFANAYAGIGWQFITHKRSALSLQAGIDNAFLLSITQKQNESADSVKSLPLRNFNRWQPSVQLAISFEGYLGKKVHFELSPFVRFGVRMFQKNGALYQDDRLSSAGIQAIYFFKK